MDTVERYFENVTHVLPLVPTAPVEEMAAVLDRARLCGRRVFVFGNGGSAATASHFVNDMVKGARSGHKPRFRLLCLSDNVPTVTAYANDVSYESIFAEPLAAFGEAGDVALAISGSGNSPNVVSAMDAAKELAMTRIGLTGKGGGKLRDRCDLCIAVPSESMQVLEDVHLVILHAVFSALRD